MPVSAVDATYKGGEISDCLLIRCCLQDRTIRGMFIHTVTKTSKSVSFVRNVIQAHCQLQLKKVGVPRDPYLHGMPLTTF